MKAASPIADSMMAPCGVDCTACYVHLKRKKGCPGCLLDGTSKPARCRECAIKECAVAKGFLRCFECPTFPCKRLKSLDASYRKRYRVSLVDNGRLARTAGVAAFLRSSTERWTCPSCGGLVSMHDGICSECGRRNATTDP